MTFPKKAGFLKLLVVTVAGLAVAGNVSALSFTWEQPTDGDSVSGNSVQLNVSDKNGDTSDTYQFEYKNSSNMWDEIDSVEDSEPFTTATWDTKGGSGDLNGDYDIRIRNGSTKNTITVTVDNTKPTVDSFTPADGAYTKNDDDLDVSYSVSDSHTSIAVKNITVDGNTATDGGLEGLSLADGSYTVNYVTRDSVGNWNNGSWSFTVDTTKDFDLNPSWDPSPGTVKMSGQVELEMTIDENNEDSLTVECLNSNDEVIDTDSGGDTSFKCIIDDDYGDKELSIGISACDQAGNCKSYDSDIFFFDASPPTLDNANILGNVVNGDFIVNYSASDPGPGEAVTLEYFYDDSDRDPGQGTSVDLATEDGEFTADIKSLDAGDHTLYMRVQDQAGRWSELKSIDFTYRPNADPELKLNVPDQLKVEAGSEKSLDVTLTNTGKLFIKGSEVSVTAENVFSHSMAFGDLKPEESADLQFDVAPAEEDLGKHKIEYSVSNYSETAQSTLIVEANQKQRSNLDSKLSKYQDRLESLKSNITELKNSGLSEERVQRIESNFTEFQSSIQEAEDAKANGNYYRISSALENIDQEYQQARSTYQEVRQEHRQAERTRYLMIASGFLLLLLAGVAVFFYESEEYDIDPEQIVDSDLGVTSLEGLKNRVRTMFRDEEEAEEFEWDGFSG